MVVKGLKKNRITHAHFLSCYARAQSNRWQRVKDQFQSAETFIHIIISKNL